MNDIDTSAGLNERLHVAARHLATELVIRNVQEILSKEGIDVLVLKGPHLGNTIYDDPLEREYIDLDLLVKPGRFQEVVRLLEQQGHRLLDDEEDRRATRKAFYCWKLQSPHGPVIELHSDLAGYGRYPVDVEGLFRRSVAFRMGNVEARGLGNEDLLMHLCLHITKSYFLVEEKHVRDIALLTRKRPIRWEQFMELATQAGCRVGAYYALRSAQAQFHADIPSEVLQALRPGIIRRHWLDRYIDSDHFPMARISGDRSLSYQARLGLPLLDRVSTWLPALLRYAVIRLDDVRQGRKPSCIDRPEL